MIEPETSAHELSGVIAIIIDLLQTQQGVRKPITSTSRLCAHLGVCEEDLDDVMLAALRATGRRPLMVGEPGSDEIEHDPHLTVEGLARFILARCPQA